jgi:hypothetical protein
MKASVSVICLSILLLQGCSKKTSDSTSPPFVLAHDGISCEIDGIRKEYYYIPYAYLSNINPLENMMVSALNDDSTTSAESISIWFNAKTVSYTFNKGTYAGDENANYRLNLNYSSSRTSYIAGWSVAATSPLTVTITRLDSVRCEGTFSGQVFNQIFSSGNQSKHLTNGVFSMPLDRRP